MNIDLSEYEIEMLTTALELRIKNDWDKWTDESKETAINLLYKMQKTDFYEIPSSIFDIII
ncbi:hypothetical protein [Methanobacterium spitsbergense]|uniref:Uncharacterized protein n=1 Tax=Methanobacterium spitsbergense TaxID=2874285 RepID=A0A8T5UYU3_9EURY|nr:hypothetical protein [Methanobacterium spitsbergense]MBZ2166340.1 hypothetical protein [Methanobacterium spitsbergense]